MTRILLVDDDATQRKISRAFLEAAGYEVHAAGNAEEAIALSQQLAPDSVPDIVVSDVIMPDLDGFGLCRRLRSNPQYADVPVLLLSAHFDDEHARELATEVGAQALVQRSPDFESELAAIARCLCDREPPRASSSTTASYEHHLHASANQMSKLVAQAHAAERRMRTLLDNASDGITVLALDGTILEANRRWESILGVKPAQMIGKSISAFAATGEHDRSQAFEQAARGTKRVRAALQHQLTGATVWMEFAEQHVDLGDREVTMAIGRDITEQVTAAKRAADAEAMYRSLVERIPDIVFRVSAGETYYFVSPNVEAITGLTPEEVLRGGRTGWDLRVHPDDLPARAAAFTAACATMQPYAIEYRFKHVRGHWLWLRIRMTPRLEDGNLIFDGLSSDVTNERTLEASLVQAQKMEAVGRLSGGIAHDFNNILAVIMANASFLLDDLAETDPRRADANEIVRAAERAAALTRQLLAFSRKQVLELRPIDLDELVNGLGKMLRRMIGEDIALEITRASVGTVQADAGQLEQVLMNLVVNSRDAMPGGGKIVIEVANVELAEALLDDVAIPPGSYVMLAVTDTGCGIDPAIRAQLFEPFFTTKEVGKGTGLGLSTCYGIVKQIGGHIWVDSEVGRGTTFKIYLPRIDASPRGVAAMQSPTNLRGSETVLLVEDDTRVRGAIQRMLSDYGYRVLSAGGADDAVSIARRSAIDLIVSDVVMPGVSGPEVIERVRTAAPKVRALLMSGYTDHPLLRNGLTEGALRFIQKPFSPETLARKVREILDTRDSP